MPSIIPGFQYDIFISYRQKDNRILSPSVDGHGWVTEFVAHLRKELEVTFKEDISVYFDENPHDGILEGHQVHDSLSGKLKCLIFIPIISQTYCDPKSFAWNNEFLAFKRLAQEDSLGMKVRLLNGNMASRIIPVRIHELEVQDALLLVEELGGALRSIDFVFNTPGVNRPLQVHEEHPHDNRNKTYYRDQVNKIANLIKEIILALKTPGYKKLEEKRNESRTPTALAVSRFRKTAWVVGLLVIGLLVLNFLREAMPRYMNSEAERITIAVMPFKVIGQDEESQAFAEGMMEVVRANLSMFPELKVKSRTSVESYRDNPKTIPEIASELSVLYILEGSAQKMGGTIRVVVQLVDTRTDENVWSDKFDEKFENVFAVQNKISESIVRSLQLTLTQDMEERLYNTPTRNIEAYDLYLRARQAGRHYLISRTQSDLDQAITLVRHSLRKDPHFALGYAWLAGLKMLPGSYNQNKVEMDSVIYLANKALELDSSVVESYVLLSRLYAVQREDVNALSYTYLALEREWGDSVAAINLIRQLGSIYSRIGDADRAKFLYDEILSVSPKDTKTLEEKFRVLASSHHASELRKFSDEVTIATPGNPLIDLINTHILLEEGNLKDIEKIVRRRYLSLSDSSIGMDQYGLMYATVMKKIGKNKEANLLAREFELEFGEDFEAEIDLYYGRTTEALSLLKEEEVGWYNLNLSQINPLFEEVRNEPAFQDFVTRNRDRIIKQREHVHQLEKLGHLPRPSDFLKLNVPVKVSDI